MLIHFIRTYPNRRHDNAITIKSVPINQDTVTVHWSQPFHLAFIELHRHQYYLAAIQKTLTSFNDTITKRVSSVDRCPHINELFDRTILTAHPRLRIKYHHLLCQPRPTPSPVLTCFYDDQHLRLCELSEGRERQANCLEFNHAMKMDCRGQTGCENDAQCFQDRVTCPQASMCVCPKCFYGRQCQFSMNGYSLSLDGILGNHIRPKASYQHQSSIVRTSLVLTVMMSAIGLVNGICTLITFKNKKTLEVGCGYYLLSLSITSLFTIVALLLKFIFLYASQMGSLTNRRFLSSSLPEHGSVAQGMYRTRMNHRHSSRDPIRQNQQSTSTIYDPLHRRLIDDQD